jgi:nucleolin
VNKIYVKGLPWTASEEEVREFFQDCGAITSCELPLDENGRSSGTAYVKFSERSELEAALALDGQTWKDTTRWLKIVESSDKQDRKSFGGPIGERPEGCDTVFVGNLPWDVTEEQMRETFAEAGEVSSVRFATGEDGNFRGFGHVQFYNGADAENAIKLAGRQINGRAIRVDYAPPRNRESFGGPKSPGRGDGGRGRGGGRGDGGRGGRGGRGGSTTPAKNSGFAVGGSGKKTTFDE